MINVRTEKLDSPGVLSPRGERTGEVRRLNENLPSTPDDDSAERLKRIDCCGGFSSLESKLVDMGWTYSSSVRTTSFFQALGTRTASRPGFRRYFWRFSIFMADVQWPIGRLADKYHQPCVDGRDLGAFRGVACPVARKIGEKEALTDSPWIRFQF